MRPELRRETIAMQTALGPAIPASTAQRAAADADLCVKCGLCLPHCPTYALSGQEADGPRGRIALINALALNQIDATPTLQKHLDGCLGCRNCERVCPAKVPYGRLIDSGQQLLAQRDPGRQSLARRVASLLASPWRRRLLLASLRLFQRLGLVETMARIAPGSALGRLAARLPALDAVRQLRDAGKGKEVLLFSGCLAEQVEADAAEALHRLLQRAGYRVRPVAQGRCCGALFQHAGHTRAANQAMDALVGACAGEAPILTLASGCGAWLHDAVDQDLAPQAMRRRVREPWTLLLDPPTLLRFQGTPERVALHLPCTQRNVSGGDAELWQLLMRVDQVELVFLGAGPGCCGAAGVNVLTHPDTADSLGDATVQGIADSGVDTVLSANVGCRMHLQSRLRRAGLRVSVLHPAEWLAARLVLPETLPGEAESAPPVRPA
jgi:glycolate oxidase iron-sulfur subunit